MNKQVIRGATIGLISLFFSVLIWQLGILTPAEQVSWDMRARLLSEPSKAPNNIVLVLLDQDSLDWAENEQGLSWPWPREIVTTIINYVTRAGARSIAFDVLYTEASIYGVYDDMAFEKAIEESNLFIGAAILNNNNKTTWSNELPHNNIYIKGLEPWLFKNNINRYSDITFPIPEVATKASILANVYEEPDVDGIYRRGNIFSIYDNKVIPSMALASFLTGNNFTSNLNIDNNYLEIDKIKIPLNSKGEAILNYRGPTGTYTSIKAAKVIKSEIEYIMGEESTLDPNIFKDAYVLFGYSASGLLDLRATPLSGKGSGVEVHATMLDNIISNNFISDQSILSSIILAAILSILSAFIFTKYQGVFKGFIFYILFILTPILLSFIMYKNNIWLPLVFMELTIIISLSFAGFINYVTEGKQKRYIKNAFKQYLSPDFIEEILINPDSLKLGGEKKEISIFFSDLEGFTTISESLSPEKLTHLINEYLTAMTDIILEEGGTIDKYEGDAIIAFWNAPIDYIDHPSRTVRAALRCQKKLEELRPYFLESVGHNLYMRIGINTGDAVVGNMGSKTRFDYTMLGDSVNLGARLEGINKQFGTYTMISENTFLKLDNSFKCRELGKVTVVGKNQAITVFEPVDNIVFKEKSKKYDTFNEALNNFYSGNFSKAIELFEKVEEDPAALKYILKCRSLMQKNVINWDGVWRISEK